MDRSTNSDLYNPIVMAKLQHLPLKHYKIKIGTKIYKVFHNNLKYAKLIRKKHTPPLPLFPTNL